MRKTLIIVMAMLISASALYAGQVGLNPWHGGFGIDMATTEYNFNPKKLEYISPSQFTEAAVNSNYSDTHMVALGGVWNMVSELEKTGEHWGAEECAFEEIIEYNVLSNESDHEMIISAECPNGFFFESISNPGARRPFELYLVVKNSYSNQRDMYSQNSDSDYGRTSGNVQIIELKNSKLSSEPIQYSYITPSNYEDSKWSDTEHIHSFGEVFGIDYDNRSEEDYKYQYMWFDVILCLPYDSAQGTNYVTSEGKMTYDNREYTLVEADDYTAIVTLRIEWNGQEKELTIPLRGYYSANITEQDSTASLSVRPRASAANLSIETMQGIEVPVADIDFMATGYPVRDANGNIIYYNGNEVVNKGDYGTMKFENIDSFYMFLSSSRNPFESDPNGFRLIRRNRGYSESPYSEDYIGFTVRVSPTAVEGANQNISPVDFDGTKSVPSSGTLSPANKAGMIQIKAETNYETGGENKPVTFTRFQATASIIMDQATTVMNDGIYEEEIYVHIVTDEE